MSENRLEPEILSIKSQSEKPQAPAESLRTYTKNLMRKVANHFLEPFKGTKDIFEQMEGKTPTERIALLEQSSKKRESDVDKRANIAIGFAIGGSFIAVPLLFSVFPDTETTLQAYRTALYIPITIAATETVAAARQSFNVIREEIQLRKLKRQEHKASLSK